MFKLLGSYTNRFAFVRSRKLFRRSSYSPILKRFSTSFNETNGNSELKLSVGNDFLVPTLALGKNNLSPTTTSSYWNVLIDALKTKNKEKADETMKVLNEQSTKPSHSLHYWALLEYYAFVKNKEMFQQLVDEILQQRPWKRSLVLSILAYYTKHPNAEELCDNLVKILKENGYIFINHHYYGDFVTLLRVALTYESYQMIIYWFEKLKTVENYEKLLSAGLVLKVIEAYLRFHRVEEAKSVFSTFKPIKMNSFKFLKPFVSYYVEQIGNRHLREIIPSCSSNGVLFPRSSESFFWFLLENAGQKALHIGFDEFKDLEKVTVGKLLHFIHYFLFKGFHQFVLHLINEWTEKPKAEKWNDVISIIKSLAFGVSPSYLETTSTNDFESRSDFNDHEMEKNDESEDDSPFSQPSPNLQTIPLNNPMEFFLHRLQVFQAFYSKVKSFGFPISSLFYFGEARLRAIIGQVEEAQRLFSEGSKLNDGATEQSLQKRALLAIENALFERTLRENNVAKAQEMWNNLCPKLSVTFQTAKIPKFLKILIDNKLFQEARTEWKKFVAGHQNVVVNSELRQVLLQYANETCDEEFLELLHSTRVITADEYLKILMKKDVDRAITQLWKFQSEKFIPLARSTLFELLFLALNHNNSSKYVLQVIQSIKSRGYSISAKCYNMLLIQTLLKNDDQLSMFLIELMKKDKIKISSELYCSYLTLQKKKL